MASSRALDVLLMLQLAARRCFGCGLALALSHAMFPTGTPAAPSAASLPGGTAVAAPETAGNRCAEPFGGVRGADISYMLATPREDTVLDHSGRASAFGQLADASRVSGARRERVEEALETDRSVVLVPWGFDEGCQPIAWTGSWRWATTDAEGFYRGRLRPPEAWIDGRPTFDIHFAVWEGFPESPWTHPLSVGRASLSAKELFDLYDRLPTAEAIAARPYGAVSDLVTWRREAGERVERYPARMLLNAAFDLAELARLRRAPLPFSGTYSVRVEHGGRELAAFFLRTGSVGMEPLSLDEPAGSAVPTAPRPASAYAAPAALATTAERLEAPTGSPPRPECHRDRGLRATAEEGPRGGAAHAWSAELSMPFVASCFADARVLRDLRAHESPGSGTTRVDGAAFDGAAFAGAFRQEPDGRFTFRQEALLTDGTPVQLIGERIDAAALPAPPPLPRRSAYLRTSGG